MHVLISVTVDACTGKEMVLFDTLLPVELHVQACAYDRLY